MRIISVLFSILFFSFLVNTVYAVTNEELAMIKHIRDTYKNDKPRSQLSQEEHKRYDFHYFNFGATGRAAGISVEALLMISDNERDKEYIKEGIKYYDEYNKKETLSL